MNAATLALRAAFIRVSARSNSVRRRADLWIRKCRSRKRSGHRRVCLVGIPFAIAAIGLYERESNRSHGLTLFLFFYFSTRKTYIFVKQAVKRTLTLVNNYFINYALLK